MKWEWLKEYQKEEVGFEWLQDTNNPRLKAGQRLNPGFSDNTMIWWRNGLTFYCDLLGYDYLVVRRFYSADKAPKTPTLICLSFDEEGIFWRVVAK